MGLLFEFTVVFVMLLMLATLTHGEIGNTHIIGAVMVSLLVALGDELIELVKKPRR